MMRSVESAGCEPRYPELAVLKKHRRSDEASGVATILVVDDEPQVAQLAGLALQRAGHVVHTHNSGFGLAYAVHRLNPDVVLLDVHMPGLKGTHSLLAASSLDANYRLETRVLLYTGAPVEELDDLAASIGAYGWLAKPAAPSAITDAVASCIALPRRPLGVSRMQLDAGVHRHR